MACFAFATSVKQSFLASLSFLGINPVFDGVEFDFREQYWTNSDHIDFLYHRTGSLNVSETDKTKLAPDFHRKLPPIYKSLESTIRLQEAIKYSTTQSLSSSGNLFRLSIARYFAFLLVANIAVFFSFI